MRNENNSARRDLWISIVISISIVLALAIMGAIGSVIMNPPVEPPEYPIPVEPYPMPRPIG